MRNLSANVFDFILGQMVYFNIRTSSIEGNDTMLTQLTVCFLRTPCSYRYHINEKKMNRCTGVRNTHIERNIILPHEVTINTAMTSNTSDEQHTRGWRELQSMLQGAGRGHGCCEVDEHRMLILGGVDDDDNVLSSGFIYDAKAKHSTPLPNNMPVALHCFSAVANERYMYVIGGMGADWLEVNTAYRLSLETFEWATLAPMGTARHACAGVLLDDYLYIFGGYNDYGALSSVERYSIVDKSGRIYLTWQQHVMTFVQLLH